MAAAGDVFALDSAFLAFLSTGLMVHMAAQVIGEPTLAGAIVTEWLRSWDRYSSTAALSALIAVATFLALRQRL